MKGLRYEGEQVSFILEGWQCVQVAQACTLAVNKGPKKDILMWSTLGTMFEACDMVALSQQGQSKAKAKAWQKQWLKINAEASQSQESPVSTKHKQSLQIIQGEVSMSLSPYQCNAIGAACTFAAKQVLDEGVWRIAENYAVKQQPLNNISAQGEMWQALAMLFQACVLGHHMAHTLGQISVDNKKLLALVKGVGVMLCTAMGNG